MVYGGVEKTKEKSKVIFRYKYSIITLRGSLDKAMTAEEEEIDRVASAKFIGEEDMIEKNENDVQPEEDPNKYDMGSGVNHDPEEDIM